MKIALTCLGLLAAIVLAVLALCWPVVPSFDQVRASWRPSDAQLLDRHGEPLHEWRVDRYGRRLAWVPLDAVSPALTRTIIASEDRAFFRHHGIDLIAVAGSVARALVRHKSRGASTITMQVAAMLDPGLARDGTRRTVSQKFRQLFAALALERRWSKRQILEAYLNLVTWRGEIQGIGAASRLMFGREPDGIDAAEATVLAALIRAPNAHRPALERRALAVDSLLAANSSGVSAPSRAEVAAAIGRALAPHFDDFARADLAPHLAERLLSRRRLTVVTTLDRDVQRVALEALHRHLAEVRDRDVHDGAALVIENSTGQVWAYVGGSGDLSTAPYVDGVRALRQPGSALKPFLYSFALDRRLLTPASLLQDTPLELPEERGLYRPLDYDREFRGLVSMRLALASSLNVPAVRTARMVGLEAFTRHIQSLGFDNVVEQGDYYGAALALGSADVSLWQIADAYRTIANGGLYTPLTVVPPGPSLSPPSRRIYSPATAYIISDILADRASRSTTFGLENSLATRFWSAVKTGTSKDMRDNWCVGFTSRFTVAVWVGNFSGASMYDVSGITGAAPVWLDVMNYLYDRFGAQPPTPPAGVTIHLVDFGRDLEPARSEWFIAGTEPARSGARLDDRARIVSPAQDSVVALDPDIPAGQQRMSFVAAGSAAGARWQLDRKDLGSVGDVRLWAPLPGVHTLSLIGAGGNPLDAITFRVRGATALPADSAGSAVSGG
jgi:penicillin-binding protein 1C